ncbi:hypothetical protein K32_24500 [Kaistia sp. 32K]|uniref:hypothetical protein n=1 Tax=Kaistia sp. 32K TaxID=2795690 RepID=UPI0019156C74|nr:hypothetical protein [Kaistia sp. 32K]BCP53833.1 hypothetical protein K32_24500 [Kaistia sp. 32K]
MKITIESTSQIVHVNGVEARIWEGATEAGVPVFAFLTRIVPVTGDLEAHRVFKTELMKTKAPSAAVEGIPLRLVL